MEYKSIRMRQAKGAKLIVLDPRKSENAEAADVAFAPLRARNGRYYDIWMAQSYRRGRAVR